MTGSDAVNGVLAYVPPDAAGVVEVTDFVMARRVLGVTPPSKGSSDGALVDYADRLAALGADPLAVLTAQRVQPSEMRAELGVDPSQFDQAATWGQRPEMVTIVLGSFEPEAIKNAVRSDPMSSDVLDESSYRGVDYFSWGPELEVRIDRATPLRPLGFGTRLAFVEGALVWTRSDAALRKIIDHALDETGGLASVEPASDLIRVATDHRLIRWAFIPLRPGRVERGISGRLLVGDEPALLVAFSFTTNTRAADVATRLPGAIGDVAPTVDASLSHLASRVEITTEGRLLVLTLVVGDEGEDLIQAAALLLARAAEEAAS